MVLETLNKAEFFGKTFFVPKNGEIGLFEFKEKFGH